MKPITVFGTWIATLVIGLIVQGMLIQDLQMALFFSGIAAVLSLPYLAIMIAFTFIVKSFWQLQTVHFVVTIATIFVAGQFDDFFMDKLAWVPIAYFLTGFLIQLGFKKSTSQATADANQQQ